MNYDNISLQQLDLIQKEYFRNFQTTKNDYQRKTINQEFIKVKTIIHDRLKKIYKKDLLSDDEYERKQAKEWFKRNYYFDLFQEKRFYK
jgi:hypothetical protein